jgi:hypothetical protein
LKDVRDAWGDLERDGDIGDGCPFGEPERVAEEDLVGTDLDEERRQSPQISEDRADIGVRGVGPPYIVRNPSTELRASRASSTVMGVLRATDPADGLCVR